MMFKLIICLLLFLVISCTNNGLGTLKYAQYVEDPGNALKQQVNTGDYTFSVLLKPIDYVTLRDFSTIDISKKDFIEHRKKYEGGCYFTFNIIPNDSIGRKLKNQAKISSDGNKSNYLNFDMQNDLKLIAGKDTLPCTIFHREPASHNSTETFVLAFDKPECNDCDYSILYYSSLFSDHPVCLTIPKSAIKAIPNLSL